MSTRLIIDIDVEDYLLDLSESHMDTTLLVYQSLIPELAKVGEVVSCRILVSQDYGDQKSTGSE